MNNYRKIDVLTLIETPSTTGNRVRTYTTRFTTGGEVQDVAENFDLLASGNAIVDVQFVTLPYTPNTLTIDTANYVRFSDDPSGMVYRVNSVVRRFRKQVVLQIIFRDDDN